MDKAYKLLLDPDQKKRALDVIHAGKEYVEHMVSVVHIAPHSRHFAFVCCSAVLICICLFYFCHSVLPTGKGEKETVEEGWQTVGRGGGRP